MEKIIQKRDFFVVEHKKKIIGTASLYGKYLMGVYTHPKYRGKGIGEKLVKRIEKEAKKKHLKKIKTFPAIGVVGFYEKLGYKIIFRIWKFIIMKKKI